VSKWKEIVGHAAGIESKPGKGSQKGLST